MTKTSEELYKLAIDFIVNSLHGTDEETEIIAREITILVQEETIFFMGIISGLFKGIMDFTLVGQLTEPVLKEFLNQRYLVLKKEGAFD